MPHPPSRERGAATVEYAGLVLLVAALIATLIAAVASSPPTTAAHELGSTLARRLRCAPALPGPCWRDPLSLAYGRPLAGAVRALAPSPQTARAADGSALLPVDFRYCRSESCALPGPRYGLTASNRRVSAFVSVSDHRRSTGIVEITYWLYRPTLGWSRVVREATSQEVAATASTPLLETDVPKVVALETLSGRDSYVFRAGEEPPWRGLVETRYPGM
jgi:Flp pilus assembly pilin Flp